MMDVTVRLAAPSDLSDIITLNDAAFGQRSEGKIVHRLEQDGDSLLSLVAVANDGLIGHIQFFRIWVDGAPVATGLGPMSVMPVVQKTGVGGFLVNEGLSFMRRMDETICFVLGHSDYYPRFGFSAALAAQFVAPWSGPYFMAQKLNDGAPACGRLTYPAAFGTG